MHAPDTDNTAVAVETDPEWFNRRLLDWHERHGRKDLPWQQDIAPYRVWVSEIMLQQTQVTTVIPYYRRFMQRFPDVGALAGAALDEVLSHWSGLGYYARARNLHKAAGIVQHEYNGVFPDRIDDLQALPGIGRSTAGAILAIACKQRHAILDGNVKRVLTRIHAVEGWPGLPAVERRLWAYAEHYTPQYETARYTQAIMDLGATLCKRANPRCDDCPFTAECIARREGRVREFPSPKPRKMLPVKQTVMLLLINEDGEVLLEKRPPAGIWGGLWSLPECAAGDDIERWSEQHLHNKIRIIEHWPVTRHTFSHFHLDITPVRARVNAGNPAIMDDDRRVWYNPRKAGTYGMAAPVARLIENLNQVNHESHSTLR